jgi:hypothetical protein
MLVADCRPDIVSLQAEFPRSLVVYLSVSFIRLKLLSSKAIHGTRRGSP